MTPESPLLTPGGRDQERLDALGGVLRQRAPDAERLVVGVGKDGKARRIASLAGGVGRKSRRCECVRGSGARPSGAGLSGLHWFHADFHRRRRSRGAGRPAVTGAGAGTQGAVRLGADHDSRAARRTGASSSGARQRTRRSRSVLEPGRRFRLNGKKPLLEDIKKQQASMIEVTGLVLQADLSGPGGVVGRRRAHRRRSAAGRWRRRAAQHGLDGPGDRRRVVAAAGRAVSEELSPN